MSEEKEGGRTASLGEGVQGRKGGEKPRESERREEEKERRKHAVTTGIPIIHPSFARARKQVRRRRRKQQQVPQ